MLELNPTELSSVVGENEGPRLRGYCLEPASAAPSSNYGAKDKPPQFHDDDDSYTGERIEVVRRRGHAVAIRQLDRLDAAPSASALVDALSFSIKPSLEIDQPHIWVLEQLSKFIPINEHLHKPRRGGYAGYKFCTDIGSIGLVAWGGEQQRGAVTFSMMGAGCATVADWPGLQDWLQKHKAKLTRVDVAHDDFEAEHISIEWAIEQYQSGGFNAGGRTPKHQCFGPWLLQGDEQETKGLTLYIGMRGSGKWCRIYQKGKQLGDGCSPWTRVEVEWRAQDRHIPYDILTNCGQYLAGAYPCLSTLSAAQSVIKTVAKSSKTVYDKAVATAKQQFGKLVHLMLRVEDGDCGAVVAQLMRMDGLPKRIEPWSYHIQRDPEILRVLCK